jgi:hypothetical protein
MMYCPKCQVLTDEPVCPSCGGEKLRAPQPQDPALLITADESKAEMIESVFNENHISYEERICGLGGPSSIIFGKTANTNKNIFVPFGQLDTCDELLNGIGILEADDAQLQEQESEQEEQPAVQEPEEKEMSRRARFVWRTVSAVLFIVVVWGVVMVADYVANALKALLTH